jgi:hypothetical protein
MNPLDVIVTSIIAYLVANTAVNFAGQADPLSLQFAIPFAASVVAACLCLLVMTYHARQSTRRTVVTAIGAIAVALGADLLVSALSGKLLVFVVFGLIPFQAWRFARAGCPRHTWLATGVAFGLVITLVSRGLFSLVVVSFLSPLGLVGAMTAFHELAGAGLARWLGVLPATASDEDFVFRVAPISGVLWGLVYGLIGFCVDRARSNFSNGSFRAL